MNGILKREDGQAVLETALVIPVILFMIMAVITVSLLIYTKMLVVLSASQGARVGALIWNDATIELEEKEEKIEGVVFGILSNGMNGVDRSWDAEVKDGSLHVTVEYKFKLILPLLGALFEDNEVPIKYEAIYYIE